MRQDKRSVISIFLLSVFFVFLMPNRVSGFLQNDVSIPSQGMIRYQSRLVFTTDFENIAKIDDHKLNLSISNWFEFQGEGGARMWMETGLSHSGSRSVGMEITDITKSRRNAFTIFPPDVGVKDELFVSVWLYLPADYGLHAPISWNWHEFLMLFADINPPTYWPYLRLTIHQPGDPPAQQFDQSLGGRDINGNEYTLSYIQNFSLPRGRWFNVQYYLLRHPANGIARVWVDSKLIFDESNIPTKTVDDFEICVAKLYYDISDTTIHRIWVDDLQIYDGML